MLENKDITKGLIYKFDILYDDMMVRWFFCTGKM